MGLFLMTILLVVVIPITEGALLALLLREIYLRHPLSLGGTIGQRKIEKSNQESLDEQTEKETDASLPEEPAAPEAINEEMQIEATPAEISVFDNIQNIPNNLSINSVLEAMTAETTTSTSDDFERIIDESSQSEESALSNIKDISDDLDLDDLQALAEALPGSKIDFSLDTDEELAESGISIAKEVLGENFDIDALAKQADLQRQSRQSAVLGNAVLDNAVLDNGVSADVPSGTVGDIGLDIQEDASGIVQVTSYFMPVSPQLAGFIDPQTILPSFSGNGLSQDWVQEAAGMSSSSAEGLSQFFFAEESRPMFVRKKTAAS